MVPTEHVHQNGEADDNDGGLGVTVGTTMLAHVRRDAPPTTTDTSVARGERDDRTTSVCGHKLWIDGGPIPST